MTKKEEMLAKLKAKREKVREEEERLKQQEKAILKQIAEEKRKKRTKHLIELGAYVESRLLAPDADQVTIDDFEAFLNSNRQPAALSPAKKELISFFSRYSETGQLSMGQIKAFERSIEQVDKDGRSNTGWLHNILNPKN